MTKHIQSITGYQSGIGRDEMGYFAYWGDFHGKCVETLRTPNRDKADRWLYQGNCHGSSAHHKSCPKCKGVKL